MEPIVEIRDLTKDYRTGFWKKKTVRALDGVSLSVNGGQIFGFLGGNGAGKTTTIKILMSLLFPTSGMAKILGRDISVIDMHREIGYCPENPYFYDYLTPNEILDYFGRIFDLDNATRKNRSAELLTKVGLKEHDWSKQLRKFSKGMLQRVGLAQSLINNPTIVFMDEPMSGLDPIGRREVRELIAGLRDGGTTVFMSTHILSDVEALCDEVAILRKGKLAAVGNLDDLLQKNEEHRSFEITVNGILAAKLEAELGAFNGFEISKKANGLTLTVPDENDIEFVLRAIRKLNGRLVSVQPVKQSLEELFVSETN